MQANPAESSRGRMTLCNDQIMQDVWPTDTGMNEIEPLIAAMDGRSRLKAWW